MPSRPLLMKLISSCIVFLNPATHTQIPWTFQTGEFLVTPATLEKCAENWNGNCIFIEPSKKFTSIMVNCPNRILVRVSLQ